MKTRAPIDTAIEDLAERMFMEKYQASWYRATGERPYWCRFSTHPQCCTLGLAEAERMRKAAREQLTKSGVIAPPQGTLDFQETL